ncbi:MAG: FMN-binding protein [Saprospiraceae bacterium]|nr:FMN-binding protein [Saprospiraceae bacterium]MCF8250240.1 FMN-binding protein [Saprospiraceae bacterium]MCF8279997.1 FMN-binding protein [Bacteroidales bacterium]MCF8312048.1 FMN-binding protein [Saprospiraceae bacterium]MCF8441145.1 FMN-binding protein [Saprospiraceae bacterium]
MKEGNPAHTTEQASSFKMLRAMVGIGLICALLIVLTFQGTLPRIEKLKAEALEKAIFKVIPGMVKKKTYQLDQKNKLSEVSDDKKGGQLVYVGYDENGKLAGVAVAASGIGFADVISILYGYDLEKQALVGFYVLESKETPGLGDKIEKDPNFLANFGALDVMLNDDKNALKNAVKVVKQGTKKNPWEIDAITGATISSRAIGNILSTSTEQWIPLIIKNKDLFEAHKNEKAQQ